MRDRFLHPLRPSQGELRLLAAGVIMALCGGVAAFVIVTQLGQTKHLLRHPSQADLWFVTSGVVGGLCGLYLARTWLGHEGVWGGLRAAVGAIIISFTGSLIGGSLALPLYGTMFGPFMLAMTLVANPVLGILWGIALIASHMMLRDWRRERQTMLDEQSRDRVNLRRTTPA